MVITISVGYSFPAAPTSISLLNYYYKTPVDFDNSLVETFDTSALPGEWDTYPPNTKTQLIGDNWIKSLSSVF
jgi:hypothetical protein